MSLYYLILWNQVDILQIHLKKGSCPYAPLDEVLRYGIYCLFFFFFLYNMLMWGSCPTLCNCIPPPPPPPSPSQARHCTEHYYWKPQIVNIKRSRICHVCKKLLNAMMYNPVAYVDFYTGWGFDGAYHTRTYLTLLRLNNIYISKEKHREFKTAKSNLFRSHIWKIYHGSILWNNLQTSIKSSKTVKQFKRLYLYSRLTCLTVFKQFFLMLYVPFNIMYDIS